MNWRSWRNAYYVSLVADTQGHRSVLQTGEAEQNRKDRCTWRASHAYHSVCIGALNATTLAKRLVPERTPIFLAYSDSQRFDSLVLTFAEFSSAYTSSRIGSTLITEGLKD